ncbi:hypothetical protein PHA51_06630 [Rodentibacter pneumotropicus]|uniref:Uncharacterized protein n=1 Tax=Rodentibacter pneumotropicus TaxID=758 RepID=A0A4S2PQ69_9PAST|nr:hypothetical protein [Rodentibacter pneumotropicus]MDC2825712.1 hypothetical protein [Rodentibacter pneumotropicus]THA05863.1 hypothetical protein D3M78_11490 [Rodentibacter pneumotropicus]
MMKTINKSPNICPLFKADPISQPFNLEAVLTDLNQVCEEIVGRVGNIQHYILYPHRVFKQRAWNIKITGDKATAYLLLNIGGYYQFINDMNAIRLSMNVKDDVDAFWLAYAIADKLNIQPMIPSGIFEGKE